jgi:soluble lytic murein transglycosylase-like protein
MIKNIVIIFSIIISMVIIAENNKLIKKTKILKHDKQAAIDQLFYARDKNKDLINENNKLIEKINQLELNKSDCNKPIVQENVKNKIFDWCLKKAKITVPKSELHKIINEAFKYEQPLLIISIIAVESNFDQQAVSNKNASGLMQVMWNIWKEELSTKLNIKTQRDLFEIDNNIKAGNYILSKYYKSTGSLEKALKKYVGGDPRYSIKVLSNYAELSFLTKG